jgi:hypothetical protein
MVGVEMTARSRIRVQFYFDPEYKLWHYSVDEPDLPGIVGGGVPSLEEARRHAAEVIAEALGSKERGADEEGVQVEYLPVVVG